jgi:hypothetical protein
MSKPKRRKAREFIVLLSMHGLVVRDGMGPGVENGLGKIIQIVKSSKSAKS